MSEFNALDADELFHLALRASAEGDVAHAILFLKQAVEKRPSAELYYLLGAQHAEIGMFERAVEEMQTAINMNPELHIAIFQLGLLYAINGKPDNAAFTWLQLDPLGENNPLFQFKQAMLNALDENYSKAIESVTKGLTLPSENEPLKNDMLKLRDQWLTLQSATSADKEKPAAERSKATKHFLLSSYEKSDAKPN